MEASAGHSQTSRTLKSQVLDLNNQEFCWDFCKLFVYWHPYLRFINHKLVNFEFVQMACVLKTLIMQ